MTYFLGILAALLQPQISGVNLPALALVFTNGSYLYAFFLGLLTDFLVGNRAGYSSFLYLVLTFLLRLFRSRFILNWVFKVLAAIASQIVFFYARGLF